MNAYFLLFLVSIFCKVSGFDSPAPEIRSRDLECINYFLNNLTNFSRQSHFVLFFTNLTKSSKLENDFLEMQIRNRTISLKVMDREVTRSFDQKSAYIIFLSKNEIEHLVELLSKAKGIMHVVFQRSDFVAENQFEKTILQATYRAKNISSELSISVHVKFNKKWNLFKIVKNQNTSNVDVLTIGICHVSESKSKNPIKSEILRVKSPNASPYATLSKKGEFVTGIDVSLMRLISEKLRKKVQFDLLNVSSYHDVLHGLIHGNLSENFLM